MSQQEEAADAHGERDGVTGGRDRNRWEGWAVPGHEEGRPCKPPAATCSVPTADQLGWRVVGEPFRPL